MRTTAEYLQDLVNQKNLLADNLVTLGVEAKQSEKFNTLVPKVLNIPYATGEVTPTEDTYVFNVSNLNFRPSKVFVLALSAYKTVEYTINFFMYDENAQGEENGFFYSLSTKTNSSGVIGTANGALSKDWVDNYNTNASSDNPLVAIIENSNKHGFRISFENVVASGYKAGDFSFKSGITYTWIAIK